MKSYLLLFLIGCSFSLLGQNIIVNNNANINVTGASSIHLKNTKWLNNGSFNAGNGTVVIEGNAATNQSTIGGTNSTTFYNLTVNKTSNDASLTQTTSVTNNLNLQSGKLEISNNDLKMGDNATFSNINQNRYINTNGTGTLQRKVGASFVAFPVGKATFNPARLKNNGTLDTFKIRVIDNFHENGTSGNLITTNVVPKTWMISENTIGGSDVTMRLVWRPIHIASGFDPNASQITHYTGGLWKDQGSVNSATADNSYNSDHKYREATSITSFSPFGVKSGAPLPVELLYFYGEKSGDKVRLDWQTATEINNSHFDVEWSRDGISFQKIGEVTGAGTTNEVQFYDFFHTTPALGENYYRLKQVDFNEKSEYTPIVLIEFNTIRDTQWTIFPNPATNYLKIETSEGGMLQLFDISGRLLVEKQVSSYENIDITQLPNGTYFAKIGTDVKKLVVQK